MADHGKHEKPKQGGLSKRGRKLGDASRKRENAFKGLQDKTSNIGRNAKAVDQALERGIRQLEKRMNKGHKHQKPKVRMFPRPRKERGA